MRQFGLIGFPLGHSWSEKYFASKFRNEQIHDCAYSLFPLENIEGLHDLIADHPDLEGLNVTIPHKETIIPFLHVLSASAASVGAVNTVVINRKADGISLIGHNTDTYGFEKSLTANRVIEPGNALVLGTGGASKAVCHVLGKLGWSITRVSRSLAKSNELKEYGKPMVGSHQVMASSEVISYEQVTRDLIRCNKLIVNTTPLGMYPNTGTYPELPYDALGDQHILFDLVYNPETTRFLQFGLKQGCQTIGGLEMLQFQAERAFSIWMEASV